MVIAVLTMAQATRATETPLSDSGALVFNHVLTQINSSLPNTAIVLQKAYGNAVWSLSGTVNGYPVNSNFPVPLYIGDDSWMATSNSGGAVTRHNGVGGVSRIIIWQGMKFNGELAYAVIHEMIHAYLAQCCSSFAADKKCNKCEHQFVHAVTAEGMCSMAQNCQLSLQGRQAAKALADVERKRCQALSEEVVEVEEGGQTVDKTVCEVCPHPKPSPFPSCPEPCSLPECN